MGKRKTVAASSDDEEYGERDNVAQGSSPERPIQAARKTGKKAQASVRVEEDDEDDDGRPIKKSKTAAKPKSIKKPNFGTSARVAKDDDFDGVKAGVTQTGEKYVELGKKKRATVSMFKTMKRLDIREFYGDEGDLKPGKKGISLSYEEWETLKRSSEAIDSFFAKLGK
ncbi:transcriptional Coactivator p15-domain-containing protein [Lenzites betulinus]|nr:transcriptional Coactivator p15-domain-containing protein [Lenzites betulinus]